MFENIGNFFKKMMKTEQKELLVDTTSKDAAKERLHIVLMQDRANVSADFLELMKQEIIDVIKKYIVIDEEQIDVRLTNQENEDGTTGAPSLYANIPILNIRNDIKGEVLNQAVETPKETTLNDVDFSDRTVMIHTINEDISNNKENENIQKEENIQVSEKEEDKKDSEINKTDDISEDLSKRIDEIDDEDDDDVTFDDLLKAAEEEEKREAEEKTKKETTKKTTSTTSKKTTGKSKGTKSSSKKKK